MCDVKINEQISDVIVNYIAVEDPFKTWGLFFKIHNHYVEFNHEEKENRT